MNNKRQYTSKRDASHVSSKTKHLPARTTPRWPHNLSDEQFSELTAKLNIPSLIKSLVEIVGRADDDDSAAAS